MSIASPAMAQVVCSPVTGTACGAAGGAGGFDRASAGGEGNGQGGGAQDLSQGLHTPIVGQPASDGDGGDGASGIDFNGTNGPVGGGGGQLGTLTGTVAIGDRGTDGLQDVHIPSGGGGGGAGAFISSGGAVFTANGVTYIGGAGGNGGAPTDGSGGGGGGGGGAGMVMGMASGGSQQLTVRNGSSLIGGAGGKGGELAVGTTWGGGGGGGGDGMLVLGDNSAVDIETTGVVTGGTGGAGGTGTFVSGEAGDAGAGIRAMGIGLDVSNHGTVQGGSGTGTGAAGAAIITQGSANITNFGALSGGMDTNGRASSVLFNGTNNTLDLRSGSTVLGAVEVGAGASATITPTIAATLDGAKLDGGGAQLVLDLTTASLDMGSTIVGSGDVSGFGGAALTLREVNLAGSLDLGNLGGVFTSGGAITTSGPQHYASSLQLDADTTFQSTGSSITFDQTIDGAHALEVYAAGDAHFGGALGASQALTSATVHSNTLSIGGVNAGSLYLDVASGISQTGAFSIGGASIFKTGGDLSLTNASNAFGGNLQIQADNVDVAASGDLNVSSLTTAPDGNITLTSGGFLTLPTGGLSTLGTIALNGTFAPGKLAARSIDLDSAGSLVFGADVIAADELTLHATGPIIQTAGAIAANTINIDAGGNDVVMNQAGNAINTVGDISAYELSIANSSALTFAGTTHVDTLNLDVGAGASITGSVVANAVANVSAGTTLTVGAGGTTGTLQADVVDNGALAFDRSNAASFSGALGGSGILVQQGSGDLLFDGDGSAFRGQTRVEDGKLVVGSVAGNGAILAGDITVADGATLGGHGSVGTTTVLTGGTLAPGASIGTLTVAGDLVMAQGTTLDFEFGAPGSPGVSDSVSVNGDLSLNGVKLDVTDTGSMGPGVYRIFDYTGALTQTNGGLSFGSRPPDSLFQLQTLLGQKQINLLNIGRSTLNFWNANGLASGSQRGGGDGTWSTTSPTWTDENGSITGAMSPQPGFAIFAGEAGLVSVDDTAGSVVATGLQFASDGYHLKGDRLTLLADAGHPAPVEIRVGDGGADTASWKATIDNDIAGVDGLRKTGIGTLVLDGTNTYSGGTKIEAGVLSVSSDANLGAALDAVTFDGGILQVTGDTFTSTARDIELSTNGGGIDVASSSNTLTLFQSVDGDGGFRKLGTGALVLSAANAYGGGTMVTEGTLRLSGAGTLGVSTASTIVDGTSATLDLGGTSQTQDTISLIDGIVKNGALNAATGIAQSGGTMAADARTPIYVLTGGVVSGAVTASDQFDLREGLVSGDLKGAASLVKSGSGTVTLQGANSYTGGTLVAAGTLVGDAGSIQGDVGNAGAVVFDQTADAAFAGDIARVSGTDGEMVKTGAGVLSLAGTSSLDWSVTDGGLVSSADRFAGDVEIDSAGSFTFDQSVNALYAGTLSGTGPLDKTGTGVLAYDGDGSSFTGTTTVQQGSLIVGSDEDHEDARLGGPVDVLSGGLLGGHGTVGTVTLGAGATIAPGNSIGTLTVAGDITFDAGSIYEVEVDPEGSDSDLIHATGTATLNGASVAHIGADSTYKPTSTYKILTADGGVDGTFGSVTSDFAFLNPELSYDPDSVYLELTRNDIDFCMAGMTANQCATGTGAQGTGSGNLIYDAIVGLSADRAANAFDQLSGEIHASTKGVLIDDSHFVRDAATDRIRAAFGAIGADNTPVLAYGPEGGKNGTMLASADTLSTAAWGRAFGAWTDLDGDGNAASLSASTGGFLTGIDAALGGNWRAGILAGYSHTSFEVDDRASSGSSQNWHLGLYGGAQWELGQGTLGLRGGAAYTWHDIETARQVAFPGFTDSLTGNYSAGTAQVFGEVAYDIKTGAIGLEPFANLAYVNLHTDGFTEDGGAAALTSGSANTDVTFATLGLRASTSFTLGTVNATARGTLGWRHASGDTTPLSTFAIAGSDPFSIAGVPIAQDAALVEAGLDLNLSPDATLGLSYQGQFATGANQNGFDATLNVKF